MLSLLYKTSEFFHWNDGRSFPLEPIFIKKDAFRGGWSILLSRLPSLHHGSFNFLEEQWDYLIVLDACRYDVFKEVNTIPGTLEKKQSLGSMTGEWRDKALTRLHPDKVLVSANPFMSDLRIGKQVFHKNIPAWDIGWDDELLVTPPWAMADLSIKMAKKFPDKRMIFWFMQPHHPFIHSGIEDSWNMVDMMIHRVKGQKSVWIKVKEGDINVETVWNAYKHNLELSMKYVKKLIAHLDGAIAVTSDHGNCFGEMGLFCHPRKIHIPPLIDVPYLKVEL